jgi:hypothetical protein
MKNQLMLKASDIMELTKSEIIAQANQMVFNFDVASKDPLEQLAMISKFQLLFETLEKGIKEKSLDDLHKLGGKFTKHGVEFAIAEVGTKYDYSNTQRWVKLNNEIESIKAKQKEVESFCKVISSITTTVDPDTGEALEFIPASKSSTTSIKKTIK